MKTISLAVFLLGAEAVVPDEPSTPTLLRLVPRPSATAVPPEREPAHPLLRLTAPPHVLPEGCRLAPKSGFESVRANPAILTDPKKLGFMHVLVMGSDKALDDASQIPLGEEHERTVERLMAERGATVEVAYAAWYEEGNGSRSIGVYALRFRQPLAGGVVDNILRANTIHGRGTLRIFTKSVAVFAWANAKEDAPDLGCLDAVRQHLRNANVE